MDRIEKKIMDQIKTNKVQMKPRWVFKLRKNGLSGITFLITTVAAIIFSLTIYFIETKTPLELFDFGILGIQIFFEDFPYFWLICSLILILGSGILISKIGENYKKTTKQLMIITIIIIGIISCLLTLLRFSGVQNWTRFID